MFLNNPVLVVDGKEFKVNSVFCREGKIHSVSVFDSTGTPRQYYDLSENTAYYIEKPLQVNFKESLKLEGRYDDVFDLLDEIIAYNEKELISCSVDYIDTEKRSIKERYLRKSIEQFTLLKIKDSIIDLID